jgi:hypothetical protein
MPAVMKRYNSGQDVAHRRDNLSHAPRLSTRFNTLHHRGVCANTPLFS